MCVFANLERNINEIVHIRKLENHSVQKVKKFSVGGKLSNVLPVNNSKQIIEETLINDISFFVSKKDLRSSPNEKK